MKALLLASAFLALMSPQKAAVTVTVNAKSGETITGERKFRVTVAANNPVTQVEFYAGNELRDKDTSTPYEFVVDSLAEKEGALRLRFKAYTTEGESGEAVITVTIDNQVSKGAPFHIAAGEAALRESKWDAAITSGRIALKADGKSNEARLLLARAYMGKGDTALAQKYAEEASEADPKNQAALDLLSAVRLRAAFRTYAAAGGNRKETLDTIREALKGAIASRRKVLDSSVDALGTPSESNLVPFVDAALRAGRYSLVINPLRDAQQKDNRRADIANRLAYAYLRQGRAADALNALTTLQRHGTLDAYSFAAMAVAKAELGDVAGADEAIKEALIADSEDPAVLAAQAYIALKFVRFQIGNQVSYNLNYDDMSGLGAQARAESRKNLQDLVPRLDQVAGARTETHYFRSALYNRLAEYARAQSAFEAAVLAEPANADAYIEMGNRALASTQLGNLQGPDLDQALGTAQVMYEAALTARPDSAQALTGLTLVATIQGKLDDAIRWGQAAVRANPDYASGHLALGTAFNLAASALRKQADAIRSKSRQGGTSAAERQQLELQAREMEDRAGGYARSARDAGVAAAKLDKRLEGQELTRGYMAWRYFSAGGRTPVLPQPR